MWVDLISGCSFPSGSLSYSALEMYTVLLALDFIGGSSTTKTFLTEGWGPLTNDLLKNAAS